MVFGKVRLTGWAVAALVVGTGSSLLAASPLEETVSVLDQWVETEQKISEARSDWETNKASMENLIALYEQEIESLDEVIAAAEEDTTAAEARRAELAEQNEAVEEVEEQVLAGMVEAELALKELEERLPLPLQEELRPLFNSLPEDPEGSKVAIGQRIQPIVGILTQVQKFNQAVTVQDGYREFEEGRAIQTKKIYFGLGASYYVDQANEHAGMGLFTEDGWEWSREDDAELIPLVRSFLNIYEGTEQARYIPLPVEIR